MCLVDLNRSTRPCNHIWYHLIQGCEPNATLETCPGKLAVEGWEIKCDFCPFCDGWALSSSEFQLLSTSRLTYVRHSSISSTASGASAGRRGSVSDNLDNLSRSTSSASGGATPPRRNSNVMTVSGARRLNRSGELRGYHEQIYDMSPVLAASERNARLNALVERYMEDSLGSPQLEVLLEDEQTRRDSVAKDKESDMGQFIADEVQEGGASGWKKHSRKLSGMFRRV